MHRYLRCTWDWLITVMDSTEAQLRYGSALAKSSDPSTRPTHCTLSRTVAVVVLPLAKRRYSDKSRAVGADTSSLVVLQMLVQHGETSWRTRCPCWGHPSSSCSETQDQNRSDLLVTGHGGAESAVAMETGASIEHGGRDYVRRLLHVQWTHLIYRPFHQGRTFSLNYIARF